jgi:hypothetical protein
MCNRTMAAALIPFVVVACLDAQQRGERPTTQQTLEVLDTFPIGPSYEVQVQGGYAYVTHNSGVAVYDVRDPARASRVASIPAGVVVGLHVVGDVAYAAGYRGQLVLVDVANPVAPRILSVFDGLTRANKVLVDLPVAYVTQDQGGLAIVDVENPSAPTLVARLDLGGEGKGLTKHGNMVYVAVRGRGLVTVDVSDPAHPVQLGTVPNTGCARSLDVQGDFLYMGCHTGRKAVFDVSEPASPRELNAFDDGGEAVADYQRGPQLWDITDASRPRLLLQAEGFEAHSAFYDGSHVYLADVAGFIVLRLAQQR